MMVKEETSAAIRKRSGRRRAGVALAAIALIGGSAVGVARLGGDSDHEQVVVGEDLDLDDDGRSAVEPDLVAVLDVDYSWSANEMIDLESRINDLPGVESAMLNLADPVQNTAP